MFDKKSLLQKLEQMNLDWTQYWLITGGAMVLYGAKDNLTSRAVLEQFKQRTGAHVTIMVEGEHWFHTELQLAVLQEWERAHI